MSTSRFALIALAGLALGGVFTAPAKAADLGGDCCADLEERVAELEATTVRKGNRKVSVQIYGHVNKAVMFWDNSEEQNTYVVDNDHNSSRFGFKGKAKFADGWSAGYRIEIEVEAESSSASVEEDADNDGGDIAVRHSAMYVGNKTYGKVWLGLTSMATDDITHKGYVAKNTNATRPDFHWNRDFSLISNDAGAPGLNVGNLCGDSLDSDACFDSTGRQNIVRYDSPKVAGFQVKAAWGEDDMADVAIFWKGKAGDFKMSVVAGYRNTVDTGTGSGADFDAVGEEERWAGSAGIIHTPTGLFVQGAYFNTEYETDAGVVTANNKTSLESDGWHIEAGIKQKWNSLGKTTIWGEYASVEDGFLGECVQSGDDCYESSELTRWGVGITQAIDAAAMELYVLYQQTDAEVVAAPGGQKFEYEDFDSVIAGGIIKF